VCPAARSVPCGLKLANAPPRLRILSSADPPIAFLLRETKRDLVFREKPIGAGSFVVVSPWTVQRHRELWQNPDAFDPGRWLAAEPPPIIANRLAFIPFGQGPRACPRKRFAEIEMHAILSELLGTQRLSRAGGRAPRPLGTLTSRPDVDFRLRLKPRERGSRAWVRGT
jgi:cytochrome P450